MIGSNIEINNLVSSHKLYAGVRFVEDGYQYDTPINSEDVSKRVQSDPTFETTYYQGIDKLRPGWSSTRGISNIDDDDYQTEFG